MLRSCETCGAQFEAKTVRAKRCSSGCRTRASRAGTVTALPTPAAADSVEAGVRQELREAGREASALGRMALALAIRLDAARDGGMATAALNKEMRSTLVAALAGAQKASSPILRMRDELAARRGA